MRATGWLAPMSDSTGLPAFLTSLWHQEEITNSCFASCGLRIAVVLLWKDVQLSSSQTGGWRQSLHKSKGEETQWWRHSAWR